MADDNEHGALGVEGDTSDPPTVDEVLNRQRDQYPEQANSSTLHQTLTDQERAALAAGGDAIERPGPGVDVEGPNPA